uniref:Metalloendopeptidase n=1 Tax=Parastrongyloides trichosuri TaxID=131310 RepID=A0A0N4ZLL3_PARTI
MYLINSEYYSLNSSRCTKDRNLRRRHVSYDKIKYIEYKATGLKRENKIKLKNIFKLINEKTCVYFKENPNLNENDGEELFKGKVFKVREIASCQCPSGFRQQVILKFYKDFFEEVIYYDIGRAIGLYFEHTRPDKDKFVKIIKDLILYNHGDFKSDCPMNDILDVPYDFGSAMHFHSSRYSHSGEDIILPRENYKYYKDTMGQNEEFSFSDYRKINKGQCKNPCGNKNPCKNNGYLDPLTCRICICPPHFDPNENCKKLIKKNDQCIQEYVLNKTKSVETIKYKKNGNIDCFFNVKTDEGYVIKISIDKLSKVHDFKKVCPVGKALEIRYRKDLSLTGAMFCKNKTEHIISEGNEIHVHYYKVGHKEGDFQLTVKRIKQK